MESSYLEKNNRNVNLSEIFDIIKQSSVFQNQLPNSQRQTAIETRNNLENDYQIESEHSPLLSHLYEENNLLDEGNFFFFKDEGSEIKTIGFTLTSNFLKHDDQRNRTKIPTQLSQKEGGEPMRKNFNKFLIINKKKTHTKENKDNCVKKCLSYFIKDIATILKNIFYKENCRILRKKIKIRIDYILFFKSKIIKTFLNEVMENKNILEKIPVCYNDFFNLSFFDLYESIFVLKNNILGPQYEEIFKKIKGLEGLLKRERKKGNSVHYLNILERVGKDLMNYYTSKKLKKRNNERKIFNN